MGVEATSKIGRSPVRSADRAPADLVVAAAIGLCLLLQLHLAFVQAINWDEFRFLADIHQHARGELTSRLQSFHVQLFGWLRAVAAGEIDQVIAGRLAMLLVESGTVAMIYRCARHFVPRDAALLAALCYVGSSAAMRHGASFRFDPPSIALIMTAAALILEAPMRRGPMLLAGLAVAIAGLITIKSVFMLPTLAAAAVYRLLSAADRREVALGLVTAAASAPLFFGLLYLLHSASLAPAPPAAAAALATHSAAKTLAHGELLPQAGTAWRAVTANPATFLLIILGIGRMAFAALRGAPAERLRAIALLAFALPLLTPLFYRNAFAYYYAWILAPGALLAGAAVSGRLTPPRLVLAVLALAGLAGVHHRASMTSTQQAQRATLAAVHSIFPKPVAYIDRASMIATYPKVGPFMSSWGLQDYRAHGQPVMRDLLRTQAPPLVIANAPALRAALAGSVAVTGDAGPLLAADAATLRDNFVPHWGQLWVAGKRLTASSDGGPFEILVAGRYTVEAPHVVRIDGVAVAPGDVVELGAGMHIASAGTPTELLLRWGVHLPVPAAAAPASSLFDRF